MADQKLTDKAEQLAPDGADWFHQVDVDDLASSPEGTSKKISSDNVRIKIIADSDTDDLSEGSTNLYNRVPTGGATNNLLAKNSGTNFDADFTGDPQVDSLGIGGSPDSTALLDVQSTTRGVLFPRMTNAEKIAIVSPPNSMQVYDTNQEAVNSRIDGVWSSQVVLTEGILQPQHPAWNPFDVQVATATTFQGTVYISPHTVVLNRLIFNVDNGYTALDTARILMYQEDVSLGTFNRVLTIEDFDPGANGVATATPTESLVVLLPGRPVIMLWGDDGGNGSFDLTCYANSLIELLNGSTTVPTGKIPTVFNTTIAANTSPATIDPTVGGANGFVGLDASDAAVVFRFERV